MKCPSVYMARESSVRGDTPSDKKENLRRTVYSQTSIYTLSDGECTILFTVGKARGIVLNESLVLWVISTHQYKRRRASLITLMGKLLKQFRQTIEGGHYIVARHFSTLFVLFGDKTSSGHPRGFINIAQFKIDCLRLPKTPGREDNPYGKGCS